ncbi:cytochrome c3 family protein [Pontiella sp.]|uniref:cytochrome c3 family protein n=1 Tax=Pontiella sp. TaxID=2837462 RepID=UPI003561F99A
MLWGTVSLAGAGYLGITMFASDDKTLFLPGETTHGHYQIELSCNECHTPGMGVLDDACVRCHGEEMETMQDSHPKSKFDDPTKADMLRKVQADQCIACHTEHNPDATGTMGVTLPINYCGFCHQEVGENRATHKGLEFDSCATAGCHNFHDNRALYERFLRKHVDEPDLKTNRTVLAFSEPRTLGEPLTVDRHDAPNDREWEPDVLADWAADIHAQQGVNCTDCHTAEDGWVDRPAPNACAACHEEPVKGWMQGRHGMRIAAGLSPMTPAMARQPMQPHALHRELDCSSCHAGHEMNLQFAAVDACLQCHADDHSLNYKNTAHFQLLEEGSADGVSCATCHMPRMELGNGRVGVQHNQNDNLRPNEKMVRSVCMNCHGVEFSLKALADPVQLEQCYAGTPAQDLETMNWIRTRIKEIEEKRRRAEEARQKRQRTVINEDDL